MIPVLYTFINDVLNGIFGWNWIIVWSHQNSPRVDRPYLLISIGQMDIPDFDNEDKPDDAGHVRQQSMRTVAVELQFYSGNSATNYANKAAMQLASQPAVNKMVELDVAVGKRLFFGYVPALMNNSQWEHRTIYTFQFYYTETLEVDAGLIETVEVTGRYTGSLTDVTCHEVITIEDWVDDTHWDDYTTYWDDGTTSWDKEYVRRN